MSSGKIINFQLRKDNRRLSDRFLQDANSNNAELFFAVGENVQNKELCLVYNHKGGMQRVIDAMDCFLSSKSFGSPTGVLTDEMIRQLRVYNSQTSEVFVNDVCERGSILLFVLAVGAASHNIHVFYDQIGSSARIKEIVRQMAEVLRRAEAQRKKMQS